MSAETMICPAFGPELGMRERRTGRPATQWLLSRVISAQKANTANGLSLDGLSLSTANLWAPTQPGGSLFGLQESNPVDPAAYEGDVATFGTSDDPTVGRRIGGVNVFGGGLALYNSAGEKIGAVRPQYRLASARRARARLRACRRGRWRHHGQHHLRLDAGGVSASGFGHPECSPGSTSIGQQLPVTNPISPPPAT